MSFNQGKSQPQKTPKAKTCMQVILNCFHRCCWCFFKVSLQKQVAVSPISTKTPNNQQQNPSSKTAKSKLLEDKKQNQSLEVKTQKQEQSRAKGQPRSKTNQSQQELLDQGQPKKYQIKCYKQGLQNIGNTCYMNSTLQCLHKSKHFLAQFTVRQSPDIHQDQAGKLSDLFCQFVQQINSNRSFSKLQQIKDKIAQRNPIFGPYQQNDALQFLSTFFSAISQELNQAPSGEKKFLQIDHYGNLADIFAGTKANDENRYKSIIEQTFTGRYKVTYCCKECQKDYVLFQKFNLHFVEIKTQLEQSIFFVQDNNFKPCKLEDCLEKFKGPEELTGLNMMTCDKCQKETQCKKTIQIYQANQILIIALKRFYQGKKNDTNVNIPQKINPKDILLNWDTDLYKGKVYKLYAAILHSGDLQGGHYTAVCLNQNIGKWIYYSDSYVHEYEFGEKADFSNAYAVFYQLQEQKHDEKLIQIEQGSLQQASNSIFQSKANSRAKNKHIQIIKCVVTGLLKGTNILQKAIEEQKNKNIIQKQQTATISSFKELNQKLSKGNLRSGQLDLQFKNRSSQILSKTSKSNKIVQLIRYYLGQINKQLGKTQISIFQEFFSTVPETSQNQSDYSLNKSIYKAIQQSKMSSEIKIIIMDVSRYFVHKKSNSLADEIPLDLDFQNNQKFKLTTVISNLPRVNCKCLDSDRNVWCSYSSTRITVSKQPKFQNPQILFYQLSSKGNFYLFQIDQSQSI